MIDEVTKNTHGHMHTQRLSALDAKTDSKNTHKLTPALTRALTKLLRAHPREATATFVDRRRRNKNYLRRRASSSGRLLSRGRDRDRRRHRLRCCRRHRLPAVSGADGKAAAAGRQENLGLLRGDEVLAPCQLRGAAHLVHLHGERRGAVREFHVRSLSLVVGQQEGAGCVRP